MNSTIFTLAHTSLPSLNSHIVLLLNYLFSLSNVSNCVNELFFNPRVLILIAFMKLLNTWLHRTMELNLFLMWGLNHGRNGYWLPFYSSDIAQSFVCFYGLVEVKLPPKSEQYQWLNRGKYSENVFSTFKVYTTRLVKFLTVPRFRVKSYESSRTSPFQ